MTNLLIKIFIKDYNNISNPDIRRKYGHLASIFGIVSNIFICIFKLSAGLLFGLISIIADGINNLTDAGSSIVSLVGFKLSSKPADKDHPFGHARIEYISGFIVSILIVILGIQLVSNSISDIIDNSNNEFTNPSNKEFFITIIILTFSILIKLFQGIFYKKIGKKINSITLIANAQDSKNDVISTSAVLLGLIISKIFNFYTDGYLGIAVGLFIIYAGFKLVKETSDPLISEKIDPELINQFTSFIKQHNEILGIHDLQIHAYGPDTYFASIHAEVDASKDILTTHDLIDNIEKELFQNYKIITTIHIDPVVLNDPYTDEIKAKIIPILNNIPYIKNIHDFRVVKGPTHTNIIFDIIINQDTKIKEQEIQKQIKDIIKNIDNTYSAVITIDHDYINYN